MQIKLWILCLFTVYFPFYNCEVILINYKREHKVVQFIEKIKAFKGGLVIQSSQVNSATSLQITACTFLLKHIAGAN